MTNQVELITSVQRRRRWPRSEKERIVAAAMEPGAVASEVARRLRILPRYRSKKDPTVTWSGRGMLPKWMREEMKGTKLTKDDFLISR
jgi:DNA-binding protein H-NS